MAGPKSTQTSFVEIIMSTIHIPTLAFLDCHMPLDVGEIYYPL